MSTVENAVGDVKKCSALEILVVCRSRATGVQNPKVLSREVGRPRRWSMFHGTTIDDLLNIVERAEEHARVPEKVTVEAKPALMPAFMYELPKQQVWYGVA